MVLKLPENFYKLLDLSKDVDNVTVNNVLMLLEDNTIPFIARYRKNLVDYLNEVDLKVIQDSYNNYENLLKRKNSILKSLKLKELLTSNLENAINDCKNLKELELIYEPYKVKKSRKIEKAFECGIYDEVTKNVVKKVHSKKLSKSFNYNKFINNLSEKSDLSIDETNDLVLEVLKDDIVKNTKVRKDLLNYYTEKCFIVSKVLDISKDTKSRFKNYYNYREEIINLKSHRYFALLKGEKEGVLKIKYEIERNGVIDCISESYFGNLSNCPDFLLTSVKSSFSSRLKSSMENEINNNLKSLSDLSSVKVFERNLENLLLKKPVRDKIILSIDPGFTSGCKWCVLDSFGNLLDYGVINPHKNSLKYSESKDVLLNLYNTYEYNLICLGNGTASKETEFLLIDFLKENVLIDKVNYLIVNESGASVYSGSAEARREFGDLNIEYRSAINLGRRVIDPLSELVKVDVRSLGVGEYQHFVDSGLLIDSLSFVINRVVNNVGIDLNTASVSLLKNVSGLNEKLSLNIVNYRLENGSFDCIIDLLKVKGIGAKVFEQCSGFLRIYDGSERFDMTSIHPENYKYLKVLYKELNLNLDLIGSLVLGSDISNLNLDLKCLNESDYNLFVESLYLSRDNGLIESRVDFSPFNRNIEDLKVFDIVRGEVRSVVSFGAFIEIGLKNDGFLHISDFGVKGFIKDPLDYLNVGEIHNFIIKSIDIENNKVNLKLCSKLS